MSVAGAQLQPLENSRSSRQAVLKVCLVVDSLGPDAGTEKLVAAWASAFDPKVIETHLCCFEASGRLSNLPKYVRSAVFPLSRINSTAGLREIRRFRSYLRCNGIEVVHSFMNKSAIFSVLAAQGICRTVVTSRLNSGYWYTTKLAWMFRILDRYSTHILANSLMAKELTASVERVPSDKITVLYQGVDLRRYASAAGDPSKAAALGIPANAPVVGIVANFRPVKDLHLFLRAAKVISSAVPQAAFLLVGQGELKPKLQALADALGIAERVFFSAPDVAVPDYLARMSVACLSSESEGLPNAILEYMAAGLPVVSTYVGGISELVRDGFSGFLVRERTPDAFAEPVIQLLQNENLRKGMGRLGLERARAEFDATAVITRLQQFYLEAAASCSGARDRHAAVIGAPDGAKIVP